MLAARLAVEDLVEELIAAKADVGAKDKWGMDLGKLMLCYKEVEQMGRKMPRRGAAEGPAGGWGIPSHSAVRVVNLRCGGNTQNVSLPHHPQKHTHCSSPLGTRMREMSEKGEGSRGREVVCRSHRPQNNAPLSRPRAGDVTRGNASCRPAVTRATLPLLRYPAGRIALPPRPESVGNRNPGDWPPASGLTTSHVVP